MSDNYFIDFTYITSLNSNIDHFIPVPKGDIWYTPNAVYLKYSSNNIK